MACFFSGLVHARNIPARLVFPRSKARRAAHCSTAISRAKQVFLLSQSVDRGLQSSLALLVLSNPLFARVATKYRTDSVSRIAKYIGIPILQKVVAVLSVLVFSVFNAANSMASVITVPAEIFYVTGSGRDVYSPDNPERFAARQTTQRAVADWVLGKTRLRVAATMERE